MPAVKLKQTAQQKAIASRLIIVNDLCSLLEGKNIKFIAQESGTAQATIHAWMSGKTIAPRIDTMMGVADALNYDIKLTRRVKRRLKSV